MKDHEITEAARRVLAAEIEALRLTHENMSDDFTRAVRCVCKCKGRVIVSGMGKSGLIGQKIAATLSSTGTPSIFMHPAEALHGDLGVIRRGDLVLALSHSGETREILALIPSLRAIGALVIALTGNPTSTLGIEADYLFCYRILSEGCPLNLAPMSSTTAMLALGDAVAAVLMEIKGFTPEEFSLYHPHGSLGKSLTRVDEIMHSDSLPIVQRQSLLSDVIELLVSNNRGAVMVEGSRGHLRGVISDGDIKRILRKYQKEIFELTAADVMNPKPKYIFGSMLLGEAVDMMKMNKITVLPVLSRNKKIIGIVQLHDLLNYRPG